MPARRPVSKAAEDGQVTTRNLQLAERKDVAVPSAGATDHVVVFYQSEDELAERVAGYLLGAMAQDGAAVVLAASDHRQAFRERLVSAGVDLARGKASGTYVELDAAEVMDSFMVNGWADPASFWRAITPVLKRAAPDRRPAAIFGEMVALLWQQGLAGAAVDVEALWNELATQYQFTLLCGYPAGALGDREHADEIAQVCGAHSAIEGSAVPGQRPAPGWN